MNITIPFLTIPIAGNLEVLKFGLRFDPLSLAMLAFISFLGLILLRYSATQMRGEARLTKFLPQMVITLLGAVIQVLSPSIAQFGLGWIIVSLGLQGLLKTESHRPLAIRAARHKFIFSRFGDAAMVLACLSEFHFSSINWLPAAPYFMVFAAFFKTASLPFHSWLLGSIEAPTPVSALLHAGIVNAGGFMLIRFQNMFMDHPHALTLLAILVLPSVVLGPMAMWAQTDYKRGLAWSTVGQMGFMLLQCALGGFAPALLHLFGHGLYKANAFLRSGNLTGMAEGKVSDWSPRKLLWTLPFGAVLAYSGLTIGYYLTGNTPVTLQGGWLLFLIQGLALTQWVISPAPGKQNITSRFMGVFLMGLSYALLTIGFEKFFQPTLTHPLSLELRGGLELFLSVIIFLVLAFFASFWLWNWSQFKWGKGLWIAATHGFYLDTPKVLYKSKGNV